jgi:signal transduction histidine kinase
MTVATRLREMNFWPRTLASQLVTVTVLAVLLSNAVVVAWFTFSFDRNDRDDLTTRLLDRATATAVLLSKMAPDARNETLHAISGDFFGNYGLHNGPLPPVPMTADEAQLAARLKTILPEDLAKTSVAVHFSATLAPLPPAPPEGEHRAPPPPGGEHWAPPPPSGPPSKAPPPSGNHPPAMHSHGPPIPMAHPNDQMIEIIIPIAADTQLVATFFRPQTPFWSAQLLLAAIVTIIISSLAAAYIAQRVTRPLSKLAEAAAEGAHGGAAPRVPEEGPEDVRNAAAAFNAMNDQVSRTLESQRHLLSAVGHDLRTPITAMRINIEFVDDPELAGRLKKNLDELQALTEAVLSAARGASGEKPRQIDVTSLAESLCTDLEELHAPVSWQGGQAAAIKCRPNEIRRALRNLIENAVAYGKKADVSILETPDVCEIRIEDEGPGISAADRQRVFEPFVRLESSRNAETGGVGLGLTLAKSIAESHGGQIVLENRKSGGLRVRMILPRHI